MNHFSDQTDKFPTAQGKGRLGMQCLSKNELIQVYILLVLILFLIVFILWLLLACIICPWAWHELKQHDQSRADRGLDSPSSSMPRASGWNDLVVENTGHEGSFTQNDGKNFQISEVPEQSGTKKNRFYIIVTRGLNNEHYCHTAPGCHRMASNKRI